MHVNAGGGHLSAMRLLARDAIDRAINYIHHTPNSTLPNAVLLGKSKPQPESSESRRDGLTFNGSECIGSKSLYEEVGPINFDASKFVPQSNQFGFRRTLQYEDLSPFDVVSSTGSGQFKDYNCLLDTALIEKQYQKIMEKINGCDTKLPDDCIQNIIEEVRQDILNEISYIQKLPQLNKSDNLNMIKNTLKDLPINILPGSSKKILNNDTATKIWFQMEAQDKLFEGPEYDLTKINNALSDNTQNMDICPTVAVVGANQTQIVRAYAHKFKNDFMNGVWIECNSIESMNKSIIDLASYLNINLKDDQILDKFGKVQQFKDSENLKNICIELYDVLAKNKTLMVFNNVHEYHDVRKILPFDLHPDLKDNIYVLMTSPNQNWEEYEEGAITVIEF